MSFRVRKPFVYLLLTTVLMGGAIAAGRYMNAFKLRDVQITPARLYADDKIFKSEMGTNMLTLPLDKITEKILADADVYRVDIGFSFPGVLKIRLNDVVPLALMLARDGHTLYCLDNNGVVYGYDYETYGLDCPIITGLNDYKLHGRLHDARVIPLLGQLVRIKETDMDLYQAVSTIDLSDSGKVVLYIEGLPFCVLTDSGSLFKSLTKLKIFLMGHNHDLTKIKQLDLRTDGLIIAVNENDGNENNNGNRHRDDDDKDADSRK